MSATLCPCDYCVMVAAGWSISRLNASKQSQTCTRHKLRVSEMILVGFSFSVLEQGGRHFLFHSNTRERTHADTHKW